MHNNVFIFGRFLRNVYYQIKVVFCFISNIMLVSNFKRASNFNCKIVILPLIAHKRTNKKADKFQKSLSKCRISIWCAVVSIISKYGSMLEPKVNISAHPLHIQHTLVAQRQENTRKNSISFTYLFTYWKETNGRHSCHWSTAVMKSCQEGMKTSCPKSHN